MPFAQVNPGSYLYNHPFTVQAADTDGDIIFSYCKELIEDEPNPYTNGKAFLVSVGFSPCVDRAQRGTVLPEPPQCRRSDSRLCCSCDVRSRADPFDPRRVRVPRASRAKPRNLPRAMHHWRI